MSTWSGLPQGFAILTALGALGVFLLGYREITSVSMRWIGAWFRRCAADEHSGRLRGLGLGGLVAAGGSSASGTVALVTMVDSEAVPPQRALWLMAGINLGATTVPWLIGLIGFRAALAVPALLLMAVSLPFRLSGSLRRYTYGDLIAGLALVLLALDLMTGRLAVVADSRWMIDAFGGVVGGGLAGGGAIAGGLLLGAVISSIIRSSVGTVVLAMALMARGWLPAEMAASAAVGSTFGLTAIAALTARGLGGEARRAAFLHACIAVISALAGAVVVLAVYSRPSDSVLLVCAAHTLTQTFGTLCVRLLEKPLFAMGARLVPVPPRLPAEPRRLHPLAPTMPESVNANLLLTQAALARTAGQALEMLMIVMNATQIDDDIDGATERTIILRLAVKDSEDEISASLTRNMQLPCSRAQAERIHQQQRIAQELSLISDDCYKTMRLLERSYRKNYRFHQESREELFAFTAQIMDFLKYTADYLADRIETPDWELASQMENQVDAVRNKLKKRSRKTLEREDDADIRGELAFIDIVAHLEHVGDRCLTISDTVRRLSRGTDR
ncbi:MAG: Na/Pi cotransporter family protein [Spirochaetaceae bacterium]|nr:MAG: Na/Pi cotransporter family protein [Spirochaetaceae bacterium]